MTSSSDQPVEASEAKRTLLERMAVTIVHRPGVVAAISCALIMIMTLSVTATGLLTFSEPGNYDWTIAENIESERVDALDSAINMLDAAGSQAVVSRSTATQPFFLMIEWKDGRDASIFEPRALKLMCEIESMYFSSTDYDKLCLVNVTSTTTPKQCSPLHPLSLTRLFYGTTPTTCNLLSTAAVNARAAEIYSNATTAAYAAQYGYFMSSDFSTGHLYTQRSRTMLSLGAPLEGYTSTGDRRTEQDLKYRPFFKDLETKLWEKYGLANSVLASAYQQEVTDGDFRLKFFAESFQALEFDRLVNGDLGWTMASILFVYLYITFHTGSFFISSAAMFQIVFSLPVAFFFYRLPLQIPFFTQLHVLAIFLVLGIGADDVFVLVDAWKQSAREVDTSGPTLEVEERRMVYAYTRTVYAVFNTSFTTAMAFVATGVSPIMPISSFGWYAAIAIILNYVFVISFTPAVLITWHRNFRNRPCCACLCRKPAQNTVSSGDVELAQRGDQEPPTPSTKTDQTPKVAAGDDSPVEPPLNEAETEAAAGLVERAFVRYTDVMLREWKGFRAIAIAVVVVLGGIGIFLATRAAQLRPPVEEEAWFADNHMFTGIGDELSKRYLSGSDDEYRKVQIVYGISGIDRTGYNRYIPSDNRGRAVFANTDLTTAAFQRQYVDACTAISTYPCSSSACFRGQLKFINSPVFCIVESVYTHYNAAHNTSLAVGALTGTAYLNAVKAFRVASTTSGTQAEMTGIIGGQLKFMTMQFTSSMQELQPSTKAREVHKVVTQFVDQRVTPRPAFHVAGREWTWMETQDALVSNMFVGLAICFPVAFAVLVVATGNIVLAFYAVLTIALIVCVVLGFVEFFMGWDLGIAQSIAAVIIVGFSIDYCVHLAHMYEECPEPNREARLKFSLSKMGGTVLGGGMTTLGAALPMALAKMTFFTTMAVLLAVTIISSLIFAQIFFVAILALIGPEGHFGDVRGFAKRVFCKKSAGEDDDSTTSSTISVQKVEPKVDEETKEEEV